MRRRPLHLARRLQELELDPLLLFVLVVVAVLLLLLLLLLVLVLLPCPARPQSDRCQAAAG